MPVLQTTLFRHHILTPCVVTVIVRLMDVLIRLISLRKNFGIISKNVRSIPQATVSSQLQKTGSMVHQHRKKMKCIMLTDVESSIALAPQSKQSTITSLSVLSDIGSVSFIMEDIPSKTIIQFDFTLFSMLTIGSNFVGLWCSEINWWGRFHEKNLTKVFSDSLKIY